MRKTNSLRKKYYFIDFCLPTKNIKVNFFDVLSCEPIFNRFSWCAKMAARLR